MNYIAVYGPLPIDSPEPREWLVTHIDSLEEDDLEKRVDYLLDSHPDYLSEALPIEEILPNEGRAMQVATDLYEQVKPSGGIHIVHPKQPDTGDPRIAIVTAFVKEYVEGFGDDSDRTKRAIALLTLVDAVDPLRRLAVGHD